MITATETLTVICTRGRRVAKLIRADGSIASYDDAKHFDLFTVPVANLDGLHRLLQHLLHRPDWAVVRGEAADGRRVRQVRWLLHQDAETGNAPTLRAVPRRWLAVDVEGVERPEGVPAIDLQGCAAVAIRRLPEALHGARASGPHVTKGIRLRLPHWLNRTANNELYMEANPDG